MVVAGAVFAGRRIAGAGISRKGRKKRKKKADRTTGFNGIENEKEMG